MNKTCARCEKTVYPTEELKCLDKVWHKGCFKCQECGMTLNMRTYKGYGKLPYCESHVPKAKHTTMAETPELKRIAENTKIQSNVKYHADFEKSKGKFTQVADDPETLRIKANTRIISNVAYHGELEKKAHMERQRLINEDGEIVEVPTDYHQQIDNYATEMLPPPHLPPKSHYQTPVTQYQAYQPTAYTQSANSSQSQTYNHQNVHGAQNVHQSAHQSATNHQNAHGAQNLHQSANSSQNQSYNHQNAHGAQNVHHSAHQGATNHQNAHQSVSNHQNLIPPPQSYSNQNVAQSPIMNMPMQQNRQYQEPYYQNQKRDEYQTQQRDEYQNQKREEFQYQYQDYNYGQQQQKIGRIQDYDPVSDGPRAPPNTQRSSATLIYNSTSDKRGAHQSSQSQQQTRQIGRVTELDPLANEVAQPTRHTPQQNQADQNLFIAMYDYEANDSDEVSFREGDLISNVSPIDSGWMTGEVVRTGRAGMLPANYVQRYE